MPTQLQYELVYPMDLDLLTYPHLQFICLDRDPDQGTTTANGIAALYTHPNISFGDGIVYTPTDLMGAGPILANVAGAAMAGATGNFSGAVNRLKAAASGAYGAGIGGFGKLLLLRAMGQMSFLGTPIGKAASLSTRMIENPNTNSLFEGVNTRVFQFQFNFVAKNEKESMMVKLIIEYFRINMYPRRLNNGMLLKYPNTWVIKFKHGEYDNFFIPGIHECFLQGMTSNYNEATNAFHSLGEPFNITMNLEFIETRALTREDIEYHEHIDGAPPPIDFPIF